MFKLSHPCDLIAMARFVHSNHWRGTFLFLLWWRMRPVFQTFLHPHVTASRLLYGLYPWQHEPIRWWRKLDVGDTWGSLETLVRIFPRKDISDVVSHGPYEGDDQPGDAADPSEKQVHLKAWDCLKIGRPEFVEKSSSPSSLLPMLCASVHPLAESGSFVGSHRE